MWILYAYSVMQVPVYLFFPTKCLYTVCIAVVHVSYRKLRRFIFKNYYITTIDCTLKSPQRPLPFINGWVVLFFFSFFLFKQSQCFEDKTYHSNAEQREYDEPWDVRATAVLQRFPIAFALPGRK